MASKNDRHKSNSGEKQQGRRRDTEESDDQSYMARGNQQLQAMVEDHEGQAVLVAFALGIGIGLVIGYGVGGPSPSRSERWIDRIAAEGLGRRLLERIDSLLPESITSRFEK